MFDSRVDGIVKIKKTDGIEQLSASYWLSLWEQSKAFTALSGGGRRVDRQLETWQLLAENLEAEVRLPLNTRSLFNRR